MQGPVREEWQELCEQAAIEQDSVKLLELTQEIERLLAEKQDGLGRRKNESVRDIVQPPKAVAVREVSQSALDHRLLHTETYAIGYRFH